MVDCPSCRATVGAGRYCANCGAPLDGTLLTVSALADEPGRRPARPARQGGRRGLLWAPALAGVVVAGLVVADRVSSTTRATAPTTTSAPATATTSPAVTTAASPAAQAAPTTLAPGPTRLAVPEGLSGSMVLGFNDHTIATLDLATGDLRVVGGVDLPVPSALVPVGDDLVVTGDWTTDAPLRLVSLADGSARELPAKGWPVSSGPSGLLLSGRGAGDRSSLVDRAGNVVDLELPPLHRPLALAGGQVLVQVQSLIATYDPATKELRPLADGHLVAADDHQVARVVCAVGNCELRAGPWEDIDLHKHRYQYGGEVFAGQLTADGTQLLCRFSTGAAPELMVVDLRNGNGRVLEAPSTGPFDQGMAITGDGRYVVGPRGSSLVFIPIDGGEAFTLGPLPTALTATAMRWPAPAEPS